jgi:hypothetical protein
MHVCKTSYPHLIPEKLLKLHRGLVYIAGLVIEHLAVPEDSLDISSERN